MSLASDLVVSLVTPPSPMLGSPDLDLNVSALMCNPKSSVYGLACVALNWSLIFVALGKRLFESLLRIC